MNINSYSMDDYVMLEDNKEIKVKKLYEDAKSVAI